MTAAAPARIAPRFEPALMRRKLTGTIFYGACIAAVGILMLTLVALLVDVFVRAAPWLDVDFLTVTGKTIAENLALLDPPAPD